MGLLKKLRSASEILNVCAALDVFEALRPSSLVFEGEGLMPFQVRPSIEMTISNLQDWVESDGVELDSMLLYFLFKTKDDGSVVAEHAYCKSGQEKRKPHNREHHTVVVDKITGFSHQSIITIGRKLKAIAASLISILNIRFEVFNNSVFSSMQWLDPQFWNPLTDYGIEQILPVCAHFKVPLEESGLDVSKIEKEWRAVRRLISSHYLKPGDDFTAATIWQKILRYRRNEYPNICKLVSLVISMSGSNSTVERAFSVLSSILSDRRLSLAHKVMNNIMLIKANDKNWSQDERAEIRKGRNN